MRRLAGVALLLGALGCDTAETESAVQRIGASLAEMTVRQVGSLASRIIENPAAADSLLAANGVELSQLDSVMYEIASDPDARAEYLAELTR